jgi:hypothetical protein
MESPGPPRPQTPTRRRSSTSTNTSPPKSSRAANAASAPSASSAMKMFTPPSTASATCRCRLTSSGKTARRPRPLSDGLRARPRLRRRPDRRPALHRRNSGSRTPERISPASPCTSGSEPFNPSTAKTSKITSFTTNATPSRRILARNRIGAPRRRGRAPPASALSNRPRQPASDPARPISSSTRLPVPTRRARC